MPSTNFHISRHSELGHHHHQFLWTEASQLARMGAEMPAVLEFDDSNNLLRIEILYMQHELRQAAMSISAAGPDHNSEIVIQVGNDNPVSFVLWIASVRVKCARHMGGSAWLLANSEKLAVGVEVAVPN